MDIPQIGAHCAWEYCNVLDFLPIACQCNKKFCSEHIAPDHHACPLLTIEHTKSTFSDKIQRCEVRQCNKPSLGNDDGVCLLCHKRLCSDHRFPDLHDCSSLTDKVPNARPVKSASSSAQRSATIIPTRKPPSDPIKLAQWQKVELMKMRHRANPADPKDRVSSVPIDQRIHIRILKDKEEKIFWLRKSVATGKALSLLVDNLRLIFPENTPLQFSAAPFHGGEVTTLRNDKPLSEQVQDGSILTIQTGQRIPEHRHMKNN